MSSNLMTPAPANSSVVSDLHDDAIRHLTDPIVMAFIFFFTVLNIRLSTTWANVFYRKMCGKFDSAPADLIVELHTDCLYAAVITSLGLNITFVLSNTAAIQSFGIGHIVFYYLTLVSWTFAITGSSVLTPIEWKLYHESRTVFFHYVYYVFGTVVVVCVIFGWFLLFGKSEHPVIGKWLFFETLIVFITSVYIQLRFHCATKFIAFKKNCNTIRVIVRHGDTYRFEKIEWASRRGPVRAIRPFNTGEIVLNCTQL